MRLLTSRAAYWTAAGAVLASFLPHAAHGTTAAEQDAKLGVHDGMKIEFVVFDLKDEKTTLLTGDEAIAITGAGVGKVTVYRDPAGKVVQQESIVFDTETLRPKEYKLDHKVSGEYAEVTSSATGVVLKYREAKGAELQTFNMDWTPTLMIGKALHQLIVRQWDKIAKDGETAPFDLMVPFKGKSFVFRVRKLSEGKIDGKTVWQLRFEPDSWLVRNFIDDMDFWYEPTKRELVRYTGVTTVPIDGDAKRKVRIDFKY